MIGCDACSSLVDEMKSLDGYTLLCADCQQTIRQQKRELCAQPPKMSAAILPVWNWLFEDFVPFRTRQSADDVHVVFYGSRELHAVQKMLTCWSVVAEKDVPAGILDFGLPTDELDIDGEPIAVSIHAYGQEGSLLVLEQYYCWVKVQLCIPNDNI